MIYFYVVSVNLNGKAAVSMSDFDMIRVLGTGGEFIQLNVIKTSYVFS